MCPFVSCTILCTRADEADRGLFKSVNAKSSNKRLKRLAVARGGREFTTLDFQNLHG
jgi:hypothetical protein